MENLVIDESTAKQITPILERVLKSYAEKDEAVSTEDWLIGEMKKELSDYAEEQITSMSKEIISQVAIFDKNLADLNEARNKYEDLTNEQWLRDKIFEATKDTPIGKVGAKLLKAEQILNQSNEKAMASLAKEFGWNDEMLNKIPIGVDLPKEWNVHNLKALSTTLGKQATLAGSRSIIANAGLKIAQKIYNGEEIKVNDVINVAIRTSVDEGVKVATSAALKICVEKGLLPVVAKGTPAGVVVNMACIGIENIKVLKKFADGEISGLKAMDLIARTSTSAIYGMAGTFSGAELGATVGTVFGPIGTILGGLVGGTVGYLAGTEIGSAIYSGAKAVVGVAVSVVKAGYNALKGVAHTVWNNVKSVGSRIRSFVSTVSSWF